MEESVSIEIWDAKDDSTALSGRCAKIDLVSEELLAKSVSRLSRSGWPISPERPEANRLDTGIISAMPSGLWSQFIACSDRSVKSAKSACEFKG